METEIIDKKTDIEAWFGNLINTLTIHKWMLETQTAPPEIKNFYKPILEGDSDQIHKNTRFLNCQYFIKKLIINYLTEIDQLIKDSKLNKLAVQLSESQILVWAEIKDEDEATEDTLILAEAKVNSDFIDVGYHISTTILEESDRFPIPKQFSTVFPFHKDEKAA